MALTQEQIDHIEYERALNTMRNETEAPRRAAELAFQNKSSKIDMLRLAKEVLVEADRAKPVEERGVSAQDVVNFAKELIAYADS